MATGPVYFCWSCYGQVQRAAGRCPHCGAQIAPPPRADYAERLIWALRHPLAEVRLNAAEVLGRRRESRAAPALRELVLAEHTDPYLAAAALDALVRIQGIDASSDVLQRAAEDGAAPLRRLAQQLLSHRRTTEP